MAVLLETHPRCMDHNAGLGHPERPERLRAVLDGIDGAGLDDVLVRVEPRPASREELERVHPSGYLDALARLSERGGGEIDPDTRASEGSWDAAVLAAGAGPDPVERLQRDEAAAALADAGERVLVVDWDAHHGNGTQDAFYDDPRVAYVSTHQSPLYPGSGELEETGSGDGEGTTLNLPFPPGTTRDVYLAAFDDVIGPFAEDFEPTWVVVSSGFDAHRADPLTNLGLTSADFAAFTERGMDLAPQGRLVAILEGGHDLDALSSSAAGCVATMAGADHEADPPTSGGPGRDLVEEAKRRRRG